MGSQESDVRPLDTQRRGIYQSLMMKALRERLAGISRELRVPLVFIKGAFSEPVLYDGRGERLVSDIDVLVPHCAFREVGAALASIDYERVVQPQQIYSNDRAKERCYNPRDGRGLSIDLHRALANPPYRLDPAALIARSRYYESVDGPVLSLEPTDQVLYTAVHYANHGFALDGRHLEDTRRLIARYPVDWARAREEARSGGFAFAQRRMEVALGTPRARDLAADRARTRVLQMATAWDGGSLSTAAKWVATGVVNGRPLFPVRAALDYAVGRVGDFIALRKRATHST